MDVEFLTFLAPDDREALSVMWQVHATLVSVGFTGLAITFQLLSDPPLTAGPARRSVISRLRFRELLTFGAVSDAAIALTSIWFHNDANVVAMFVLAFLPTIAAISITYAESARLFGRPHEIEQMTFDDVRIAVRAKAKVLSKTHVRNRTIHAAVENMSNVSYRVPDGDQRTPYPITYSRKTGVVLDIDLTKLTDLSRRLAGMVQVVEGQSDSPIACLRIGIGDTLEPGTVVAEVYGTPDSWDRQVGRLEELLANAIALSDKGKSDAGSALAHEIEDLQDDLISAIHGTRYGSVRRGLDYYSKIISDVREEVSDPFGHSTAFGYGGDWDWLTVHLWEINDAAAAASERLASEAIEASFGRCVDSLENYDANFFRTVMQSYVQIWLKLLRSPRDDEGSKEHLLVSLQNLTQYVLPASGGTDEQVVQRVGIANEIWLEIVKTAVDEGNKWASRALAYHSNMFRLDDGRSVDSPRALVQQSNLMLLAWLLYIQSVEKVNNDSAVVEVLDSLSSERILMNIAAVSDGRRHAMLRDWEMRGALPLRTKILSTSEFLIRAALLALARYSTATPSEFGIDLYHFALRAKNSIDEFRDSWRPDWNIPVNRLIAVEGALDQIIENWRRKSLAALKLAPLGKDRVEAFKSAFSDGLRESARPIRIFDIEPKRTSAAPIVETMGGRTRVPKYYFVQTDVYADPVNLGASVANFALSLEADRIIFRCVEYGVSRSLRLAEIQDYVLSWIGTAIDPAILVLNSHQVQVAVGLHTGTSVILGGRAIPAMVVYPDREIDEHLVLVDRGRSPRVVRSPEVKAGTEPIAGDHVSIGIFDIGIEAEDGTPIVEIEFGTHAEWSSPVDSSVQFIRVVDSLY